MTTIPISIVTGFLGAGKTTFLNRALTSPDMSRAAVVVNEFGEIGLDHLLVASSTDTVRLLDSGCLCCEVNGSLRETLIELFHSRSTGQVPPFEHVVVETSGLADPRPILESALRDSLLRSHYALGVVVTMIDAASGADTLASYDEARAQVALADRIVVTKTDRLTGGVPDALLDQIRALNPHAALLLGAEIDAPAALLCDRTDRFVAATAPSQGPPARHAARHAHGIVSLARRRDRPTTWAGIAAWTGHLQQRWGDDLLRCKALLPLAGQSRPAMIQGVRTVFAANALAAWPDQDRGGRIVLIGHGLDARSIDDGLAWLDVPSGINMPASAGFPDTIAGLEKAR